MCYNSFISKDSKNVDLAMKFMNYMYDLDFGRYIYSGEQGVTWDYDENGVPHMFEEALADKSNGGDYWQTGEGKGGHSTRYTKIFGYNPAVIGTDGYPLDLSLDKEAAVLAQNNIDKDIAAVYGVKYFGDAYPDGTMDFRNNVGEAVSGLIADLPMDSQRVLEYCDSVLESNMANLIMCDTEEEFNELLDEIVAEVVAAGEPEVFEAYKAEWDRLVGLMIPVRDEMLEAAGLEAFPVE